MIRLHHCPGTRSMRVLWLLYELAVDFDLEVYPFDKTLRSEAYLKLNPAGRVPALELDGHVIRESGAMIQVLCERFDPRGLGRPLGHKDHMAWLDWIHFAETVSAHCANLTQQHLMLREDHMRSPIIMKLEAARLGKTLAAIEARLESAYLLGSGFSAADVAVGQAVYMAKHFVHLDATPKVAAWFDVIAAREAFQAALPGDDGLYGQDFYAPWPVE